MSSAEQATLLIVEDDLDIADMLGAYFRGQGYAVQLVNWGEDGLRACQEHLPDLVILDIRLPDIDGFEVARRLRASRRTQKLPIIFLTEKRERQDRLKGLALDAEDYITKPFDITELRLRVHNALQRVRQDSLTNPVTGLPQGGLVDDRLSRALAQTGWHGLVILLKNLERFREIYGFVAADDLVRAVALMLEDSLRELGGADDFLGQLGAESFVIIAAAGDPEGLRARIEKRLENSFDYFYRDQDREADIFQGKRLGVDVHSFDISLTPKPDLQSLKTALERFYR